MNVQALGSSFGSGTALNSTIAWDFGDPGSKYNTLVGFNAAHAQVVSRLENQKSRLAAMKA